MISDLQSHYRRDSENVILAVAKSIEENKSIEEKY